MSQLDLGFDWEGIHLAGTLYLPDTPGPNTVVIMLQGSGPSDRDGDGYFIPIRDAFLDKGVGVYSFDKPGCGESTGDWRDYALQDRADQGTAARALIQARPEALSESVGFWGQSQGGWLVQILAARHDDLSFAISNSGPSIGVESQDLYACEHMMRADGCTESDIEHALDFVKASHTAAVEGMSYQEVLKKLIEPVSTQPWHRYVHVGGEGDWELMRRFLTEAYDPLEAIRRISCPYLAVYGGRDVLVPAWESAHEVGLALERAPTLDSTVVVFPGGDHRVHDVDRGGFAAGYLELLRDWIQVRGSL
jgi:pimeloyl-ACP methyl ester carboxylesterase